LDVKGNGHTLCEVPFRNLPVLDGKITNLNRDSRCRIDIRCQSAE